MRDFLQNCCRKRIFFRYLQSERRQEVFSGRNSSAVEHFTRNEGVPSSNLGFGSKSGGCIAGCDLFFVCGRRRGRDAPHLPPAERRLRDTDGPHTVRAGRPHPHPNRDFKDRRHAGNVFRISVPFPPGESATSLYSCFYLKEFDCQAVVTKRRIRIGGLKPKCRPGPESGPFCRTNAAGRQPGMENPRNGRPEAYVVWQTTNPLISKKSGPRVAGIQAVSGEDPAPRGSVPLHRKADGSRADRQLSATCVAEYGVRRFKTDAHPALHTICRKRKI